MPNYKGRRGVVPKNLVDVVGRAFVEDCKDAIVQTILPDRIKEELFLVTEDLSLEFYDITTTKEPCINTTTDILAVRSFLHECAKVVRIFLIHMSNLDPTLLDIEEERKFLLGAPQRQTDKFPAPYEMRREGLMALYTITPVYVKALRLPGKPELIVGISPQAQDASGYARLVDIEWEYESCQR